MADHYEQIINILKTANPYIDDIEIDTQIIDEGIIDSLQFFFIISEIESRFNITIAQEDMTPENFSSVKSINKLFQKYGL